MLLSLWKGVVFVVYEVSEEGDGSDARMVVGFDGVGEIG